ncbi:MAG: asparagine synthase (glutamine-hydrolyzing) [Deltaproteobacteria bacterium]|nr:asparagine synthase (glutamine-hydrolyzing) [Deltaproteobacteria bacterium]
MCGLAGLSVPPGAPIPAGILRAMTNSLRDRGPDDEGYYVDAQGGVGLGHRRLSIIDLTGGHQPLSSPDGRIQVVVNGEIYNFVELRRELEAKGHVFRTRSDCEVVVFGYLEWGREVLSRLEGMFAIALWDQRDRRLLLARDRMGKKPLFYARVGDRRDTLIFGSELKALLAHPLVDRTVGPSRLADYLVYECLPEDESILLGVNKLLPGHGLAWRPSGVECDIFPFWRLDFEAPASTPDITGWSEQELAERLRQQILEATKARLVSDVPLGVFLSGGIDSSVVTAAMAKLVPPKEIQTFSITFEDPSFDEGAHARRVAAHLGTTHHEERLAPSALTDVLPKIFDFLCEPLGDASIVPTYLLSKFVRQHVKVALGGDGGDELFLGYPTFQADLVARVLDGFLSKGAERRLSRALGRAASMIPVSRKNFSFDFKVKRFALGLGQTPARRHQAWMGSFTPEQLRGVFAESYLSGALAHDPYELIDRLERRSRPRDHFDSLVDQYLRLYLTACVLVKVDRASMASSLEVRAPLLDTRVVELAARIPGRLKQKRFTTKYILKQAARAWLPPEIVDRPKKGFGMPVAEWLRGPLRPLVFDSFGASRLRRDGYFDPSAIAKLIDEHDRGVADHRKPLWTLLVFQSWLERFGPGAPRAVLDDSPLPTSQPALVS